MKTYEIKRYDNFLDYDDDQCKPVVITEKQMSFYLLRVHCDSFATALNHFCEVFAGENVDWKPIVAYIIDNHRHSNHITDYYWVGKTERYSYFLIWRENGLCEVSIILYRWNIPTDETTNEETQTHKKYF